MNQTFYTLALVLTVPVMMTKTLVSAEKPVVRSHQADEKVEPGTWRIDSQKQWTEITGDSENLIIHKGFVTPTEGKASFSSIVKRFETKRQASRITFTQSPLWDNWTPVPSVGPKDATNAPIFLPVADGDYWYFGEFKNERKGYHAWRSADMKTWKHVGPIGWSRWATTAEYADGKIFLYYDEPNDQDPHLIIIENLDSQPTWRDAGKVLDDPTHGSDAGVIRTSDGVFHLIYEDWSPIDAKMNSWDSPLAGHSDSVDGIHGFEPHEHPAPIDRRTNPTGKIGNYKHVSSKEPLEYEIHQPAQNAYGDYTLIQVGKRIYMFCDYDPHNGPMRVGRWMSESINTPFEWCGDIGMGFHPDPTIGFAEGKFYLIVQRAKQDYISPGPWVGGVSARVGVDTDGDNKIDQWTKWNEVREQYHRKDSFSRIVETIPATLDLSLLPEGFGFQIQFKTKSSAASSTKPVLDRVVLSFADEPLRM